MLIKISVKKHIIIISTPGLSAYTLIEQIQQSWNKIILKHALIVPLHCPYNFSVSPLPRELMANYSAWKIYPSMLTPSNFHSLISSYFWYKPDVTSQQSTTRQSWPRSHLILPSSVTLGALDPALLNLSSLIWLIVPSHCTAGRTLAKSRLHVVLASEALSNEGSIIIPNDVFVFQSWCLCAFSWNIAENSGFSYLLILQSPSSCVKPWQPTLAQDDCFHPELTVLIFYMFL